MRSFAATNEDEEDDLHPEVTPCLKAKFSYDNGSFTFRAFPDTGGCLTMIAFNLVAYKKIRVDYSFNIPKLIAVNGENVRTDGVVPMEILNTHNGKSSKTLVIVSPDVKNDIIISFPQLKKLEVVPKDFPFSHFSFSTFKTMQTEFDKTKNDIINEFSDVVHDKLPPDPMKGNR